MHIRGWVFAQPGKLNSWTGALCDRTWEAAFRVMDTLPTTDLHGREPFGFADGISEPELDWELKRSFVANQLTYTNLTALGEFLLGFENEYGKYTDRPLLKANGKAGATRVAAKKAAPAARKTTAASRTRRSSTK